MPSWKNNVQHIANGEPVSAGVTGRPDRTLEGNLQYLRDVVDSSLLGQLLLIRDATVESTVLVGQPVYWNASQARFEAAIAAVEDVIEVKAFATKPSSDVVGVVQKKTNSTLADIATLGWASIDLSNSIDGTIVAGRYYLSSSDPGKLVSQRPPVSVPVLFADGLGNALVMPILRDFFEDHVHYSFNLAPAPAGDHVNSGGRHVITSPDPSKRGWLPADHGSFGGLAPPTAMFGYNLAVHNSLSQVWPPVPLSAVSLTWDKGDSDGQGIGGVDVPLGAQGLCVIDANGIWWMSDVQGDVPWPKDIETSSSSTQAPGYGELTSEGSYQSLGSLDWTPESPRFDRMRLVLNFSKMSYATDKSVVTSLEPEEGSRITVENCDGEPATTGALKIDLDLGLAVIDSALEGFQVIKDVTSHEYQRGPIVEGIFQGTGAISLSSTAQLDVSGDTLHQGRITLTSDLEVTGRELMPQIVRLNDVIERYFEEVPYLGFASGRESSVRFRFHLPPGDLGASPKIKLRAIIIGRGGPTFPQALPSLVMTYRLIARPTSPTALPTTDTSLTFDPTSVTMTALNEYAEVESSNIDPVAAGDTLLIEITRSASDGYAGEVGIMRLGAIFV